MAYMKSTRPSVETASGIVTRGLREPTARPAKSTPATPNRNPKKLTFPSRTPNPITTKSVRIGDALKTPASQEVTCIGRSAASRQSYQSRRGQ